MSKKHSTVIAYTIVVLIPILLIGSIAWFINRSYQKNKELIIKEISDLGVFDDTSESMQLAKEMGIEYPVAPPSKTPDEIKKEIDIQIKDMLEKDFKKMINKAKLEINRKYTPAKIGETVTIISRNSKSPIKGKYWGLDGNFVKIENAKIRLADVGEDFQYLFDEGLADKVCREKFAEIEEKYQYDRKVAIENLKKSLENELYPKYGYQMPDEYSEWISNEELFKQKLEKKRSAFEKKISEIEKKHRLFGIIDIKYK